MIWFIFYILIASAATFGLCYAKQRVIKHTWTCDMVAPVICGILWPICAPVYGAYLAAMWYGHEK